MNTKQTSKWLIDATLFFGFIVAFLFDLTGLGLHQWTGVAVGILTVYHFITHWNWIRAVSQRLFGNMPSNVRLYYVIDGIILFGLLIITITGLSMSSWFDLALTNAAAWLEVHILASIFTLVFVVVKVGLHWRWVVSVAKKGLLKSATLFGKPVLTAPTATSLQMSRREFLHVMGVVGVTSMIALSQAVEGLQSYKDEQPGASEQVQAGGASSSLLTGSSKSCTVQCGKRCSFLGQCRRFVDTNGNNRCDHGECM